jgi:chloramphenicol O-acetyltransferase type B
MKENFFKSPFKGLPLNKQVTNPNIIVGKYSYYSGYYHGHSFDECARYLMPDRTDVDKLIIGDFCSIGTGASFIMAGNQGHRMEWVSSFPFFYFDDDYTKEATDGFKNIGDTKVGSDVWIGSEAIIMPGVELGHGCVIGTRAVVTKDVPAYAVVAGNPAKLIRYRFSEAKIHMLLEMSWWDWPEERLSGAMKWLCSEDIEGLHSYWEKSVN